MQLDKATSALCQNVPFLCPGWGSWWWETVYCQNPFFYSNFCCSIQAECSQGARLVFHRKVGTAQQHLRVGFLLTLPCHWMTARCCLRTAPVYIFPNAAEKVPCSLLNPHGMGPHTAKETTASESGSQSPRECCPSPSVPFAGGGRIWSPWLSGRRPGLGSAGCVNSAWHKQCQELGSAEVRRTWARPLDGRSFPEQKRVLAAKLPGFCTPKQRRYLNIGVSPAQQCSESLSGTEDEFKTIGNALHCCYEAAWSWPEKQHLFSFWSINMLCLVFTGIKPVFVINLVM